MVKAVGHENHARSTDRTADEKANRIGDPGRGRPAFDAGLSDHRPFVSMIRIDSELRDRRANLGTVRSGDPDGISRGPAKLPGRHSGIVYDSRDGVHQQGDGRMTIDRNGERPNVIARLARCAGRDP